MALTPYKNPESPLSRIRSSSCSSPARNRIVYQEIYSVGFNTLVRSYSCDQVFNKDEAGRTFQTTQIQISSFLTPKKVRVDQKAVQDTIKNQTDTPKPALKLSDMSEKIPQPRPASGGLIKTIILYGLLPIVCASLLFLYQSYKECGYVWDLERTKIELMDNVFGQSEAIGRINSVLKQANNTNDFFVLAFTGGVGVGKTYSSSIIRRNFPWSSKTLITHSEHFNSDVEKLLKSELSPCGCNLIIVDDLSLQVISDSFSLVRLLNSKRKSTEKLLLILIYQVHDESERKDVVNQLSDVYMNFYHVPFQTLTRDVVEKCFNTEIQRLGIEIPKSQLSALVSEKMKHIDITKGPVGCKGVTVDVLGFYKKNQQ